MLKALNLFLICLLFAGSIFAEGYEIVNPPLPSRKFANLAVIRHVYERDLESETNHTHFIYFNGGYKIIVRPFMPMFDDSVAYLVVEGESEEYILYKEKGRNKKNRMADPTYGCNAKVAFFVLGFETEFYLADASVLPGFSPDEKNKENDKVLNITPQKGVIVFKKPSK